MNLLLRRVLAGVIDYGIVLVYAGTLFLIVTTIPSLNRALETSNPIIGQLIGLISLTLPAFFYFYQFENGEQNATVGKRLTKIKLQQSGSVLKRNILKFLPWEIAHTGVHWLIFYSNNQIDIPVWVWTCLIIPQAVVSFYALSIVLSHGKYSLYDRWSQTAFITTNHKKVAG